MNDARNLVWSYLGQCSSFDPSQLQVFLVQGDWFVQALPTSPQQYGLWKVDALTGGLTPHDVVAREWQSFIESECSPEILETLFTPTPTLTPTPTPTPTPRPTPTPTATPPPPTPTPVPTPTPTPTPTPLVTTAGDAVASLWAHLVKCFITLPITDLEARLDPAKAEWVVITRPGAITSAGTSADYGVWRVDRQDGTISPENREARNRDQIVTRGC